MDLVLIAEQTLNGLQLGVMLFLLAAGLTLVFGIMNFINLAHGALYMVGAYLTTYFYQALGGFVEDQQARIGHQRAADRQHLLLAAG